MLAKQDTAPQQHQPQKQPSPLDALLAVLVVTMPALAAWIILRRPMINSMTGTRLAQLATVLQRAQQAAQAGTPVNVDALEQQLTAVLQTPPPGMPSGPAAGSAGNVGLTEISAAMAGAQQHVYTDAGVVEHIWVTARDDKVCPVCHANAAQGPVSIGLPFTGGVTAPPQHPRCLPGDTLVTASSRITGVTSREYHGDFVSIRTLSGKFLTATPNHPVLTNHGWVAAVVVQVGEQVVTSSMSQRMLMVDNDNQHVPASIQQIAEAFLRSRQVVSAEMPVAAEDFHGDGAGSEVCVVGTDRGLPLPDDAVIVHEGSQQVLQRGDIARLGFTRLRQSDTLLVAERHSTLRRMRRAGKLLPLFGTHSRHTHVHASTAVSRLNAVFQEPTSDYGSADAEGFAQRLLALSSDVTLDEVTNVEVNTASRHVYNLETEDGWYIANGIVTHNCRCTLSPTSYTSVPSFQQFVENLPPRRFNNATLEQEEQLHIPKSTGAGDHEVEYGRMEWCPRCDGKGCLNCHQTGKAVPPKEACVSCGCLKPHDDHGDARNITQEDVEAAGAAVNLPAGQAAANIADAFRELLDADDKPDAKSWASALEVLDPDEIYDRTFGMSWDTKSAKAVLPKSL